MEGEGGMHMHYAVFSYEFERVDCAHFVLAFYSDRPFYTCHIDVRKTVDQEYKKFKNFKFFILIFNV